MTAPRPKPSELPGWPRLLTQRMAAAYLGMGVNHFSVHVKVPARTVGGLRVWDRLKLDEWVDAPSQGSVDRILEGLDGQPAPREGRAL